MKPVPRVRDMMNRKPVILDPDTRMGDVARIFLKKKIPSAAVVDEEQRFVGVVSTQGLMLALVDAVHDEVPAGAVAGYLDPDPPRLTEKTPLMVVAEMFVKGGYTNRSLPVLRGDRLVGLVTRLGVIQAVMNYLAGVEDRHAQALYISALKDMDETPPF
jgi:CBS domain-containing protein